MKITGDYVIAVSDAHLGGEGILTISRRFNMLEEFMLNKARYFKEKCTFILLGDMLDFGFAWESVVTNQVAEFVTLISKVKDEGARVIWVLGNHDQWLADFLSQCGFVSTVIERGALIEWHSMKIYVEHGDRVLATSWIDKRVQKIFRSRFFRKLFRLLVHPDLAVRIASRWSATSREQGLRWINNPEVIEACHARLIDYIRELWNDGVRADVYLFGHVHSPCKRVVMVEQNKSVWYVNTGDWLWNFSWVEIINGVPCLFRKKIS